ncbi:MULTISPECIES: STAS domain-containing protein [unclassified Modicisalibacter]|uniref:STAS domain-containing protein n=1 Tax=unclassified Modicisalibacter TaxID=2679913 RepID=UPI001CCF6293|nr:STAS domain-containing protein [Modicisalibacter sp. R2A 31.J]MBZ9574104.1 STAS domain-containing protein [Modicisalibacter sp. MOD 31.J]
MKRLLDQPEARLEVDEESATLAASGDADFEVAAALAARGCEWLETRPSGSAVCFDLCGVSRVSSAAISVVLEWLRCARRQQLEVTTVRLSVPLARLTDMAGLDLLFPHLEKPT